MIKSPVRTGRTWNALKHPVTELRVKRADRKHVKQFPSCTLCGYRPRWWERTNEVHKVIPAHISPELACDPRNRLTMCRLHHFVVGHLCNWKDFNSALAKTVQVYVASFLRISQQLPKGTRRDVRMALALLSGRREREDK